MTERLTEGDGKVERSVDRGCGPPFPRAPQEKEKESIFSDRGAKKYGKTAQQLFNLHLDKKKIPLEQGLKELSLALNDIPNSFPQLVCQILTGSHDLTGKEMTKAYRAGSCGMRTVLVQWCHDPLEELNQAFLEAVITKQLT